MILLRFIQSLGTVPHIVPKFARTLGAWPKQNCVSRPGISTRALRAFAASRAFRPSHWRVRVCTANLRATVSAAPDAIKQSNKESQDSSKSVVGGGQLTGALRYSQKPAGKPILVDDLL